MMNYKTLLIAILTIIFANNIFGQETQQKDTLILFTDKGHSNIFDGTKNINLVFRYFVIQDSFNNYYYDFISDFKYKDDSVLVSNNNLGKKHSLDFLYQIPINELGHYLLQKKIFFILQEDLNKETIYLYPVKFDGILNKDRRRDLDCGTIDEIIEKRIPVKTEYNKTLNQINQLKDITHENFDNTQFCE